MFPGAVTSLDIGMKSMTKGRYIYDDSSRYELVLVLFTLGLIHMYSFSAVRLHEVFHGLLILPLFLLYMQSCSRDVNRN